MTPPQPIRRDTVRKPGSMEVKEVSKKKDGKPAREGGNFDNVGSVVIFPLSPALIKRLRKREERRKAEAEKQEREGAEGTDAGEQGGDGADE